MLSLSFTFFEVIVRPGWDAYLGRNFILAILFLTPFLGRIYPQQSGFNIPVLVVVALSGYMVFNFALNNTSKPLIGQKAIWILDRVDKILFKIFTFVNRPVSWSNQSRKMLHWHCLEACGNIHFMIHIFNAIFFPLWILLQGSMLTGFEVTTCTTHCSPGKDQNQPFLPMDG